MNNKILIGSMLVLTLLLLMPSIPAIQYNTINENIYEEQYRANVKEIFEERKSGSWKYPFMWFIFLLFDVIAGFRLFRGFSLMWYSASNWYNPDSDLIIEHPVLLLRGLWLFGTSCAIIVFLNIIYDKIGWGQGI